MRLMIYKITNVTKQAQTLNNQKQFYWNLQTKKNVENRRNEEEFKVYLPAYME